MQEKNHYFCNTDVTSYLDDYATAIRAGLTAIDAQELENARLLLKTADRIFVAGNGGSAAISDHLLCDFQKGVGRKVISLSNNPSLLSALHNDLEFPDLVFDWQLNHWGVGEKDVIVLISSSGISANIMRAAQWARANKVNLIGLTGFTGGGLKELSNVSLHIPIHNYGVVEDAHQALMHILSQFIYLEERDARSL